MGRRGPKVQKVGKVSSSTISYENISKNEKIKTYFRKRYDIIEKEKFRIFVPALKCKHAEKKMQV